MRKNNRTNRPLGFHGYYVDVPEGGDVMRAYRKMKKWIKNDRFVEELKDRQYFQKPSHWKRETEKRRKQTLKKLQSQRDDNRFMGIKRKK
jgi:ribosomal protein S21|tara:strand:+ start:231 stop:500 length:270 start_codon:yes stop_codon:yes gene_type:complete